MTGHWFDYLIITIIGLSVLTGLFRGFVKELVALGVWILAFWFAYHYSYALEPWLEPYLEDQTLRTGISFIAVLLATLTAGGLFNALLAFILKRSGLSATDRILGMGFGIIRGIFIVALLIVAVKMTSLPDQEYRQQSQFYAKFDPVVNWISGLMPEFIKQVSLLERKEENPRVSLPNQDYQILPKLDEFQFMEDEN
ncbi:CvpA family protein [Legionella londiniensis]|uniref:Colicin V n=1 Tax=Legionella londiniensis TaxID=45068 RepID=A0A0W0VM06_9GAMM|nr:CvpA family protein [Legionella londiniensis]KTD21128.1 colicin V [Legionella londiniensis]STX93151.1 colicin V [Legionella londiniensis]